jgi:hypothetical protein
VLTGFLLLFAFCQSIYGAIKSVQSDDKAGIAFNIILCKKIIKFVGIYSFAGIGFVGTLLYLHTYLTKNNITTYEYCKDSW